MLAKLGIDPSRLLPYLAAEGRTLPSIEIAGAGTRQESGAGANTGFDPPQQSVIARPWLDVAPRNMLHDFTVPLPSWLQEGTGATDVQLSAKPSPREAPHADPFEGPPSFPSATRARTVLSQIDPAELARSLASFSPEVFPRHDGVSGIDRVLSAASPSLPIRGEPDGSIEPIENSALSSIEPTFPQSGRDEFGLDAINPVSRFWISSPGATFEGAATGENGLSSSLDARLARAVERLERIAEQFDQLSPTSRGGPSRPFRGRIDA